MVEAPAPYWALPLAATVSVAVVLYALPISSGDSGPRAALELTDVRPPPERAVSVTMTLEPSGAADGARWFNITSWQGEERSIVAPLEQVREGGYRTSRAIPVHGSWKSILRLHTGDAVLGLPIFLPEDRGIPAPETSAPAQFARDFRLDKRNLQREQKDGVSSGLTTVSHLAVLALTAALLAALVWGLRRIRVRLGGDDEGLHGGPGVDPTRVAGGGPGPSTA